MCTLNKFPVKILTRYAIIQYNFIASTYIDANSRIP